MGMDCPVCGLHGGFVHAITATGEMAKKSRDIIARKLSCGHVVGSQAYMQYRERLQVLENAAAEQYIAIEEALKDKKTALWATIIQPSKET
jgi:DNA-directed RNA polymerase subunit N (RpoN/RPB10)